MLEQIRFKDAESYKNFVRRVENLNGRIEIYSPVNRNKVYSGKIFIEDFPIGEHLYIVSDKDIKDLIQDYLI